MGQGFSLHIGLNGVDASKYNGWPGTLSGCINDANAMEAICRSQGFTTQMLLNGDAVADAILGAIGQAAFNLQSGDTFIISYSGHGGQVPDTTGTSPNGLDDTWVAYDRMVLGHELYNLWGQFESDVRIEVYSDSCHSGTVIRELFTNWPIAKKKGVPLFPGNLGIQKFKSVYGPAATTAPTSAPPEGAPKVATRAIPQALALALFERDQEMYEAAQWSRNRGDITASVILISGCQDNQVSLDGQNNGLFTEKLLGVWGRGSFTGTLPQFHKAIVALMPSSQTPNYFTVGLEDGVFTDARPLTIVETDKVVTTGGSPVVTGPTDYAGLQDTPPSFLVNLGSNPYYIFEITSDPACFGNSSNRTSNNFYASWADPQASARNTNIHYTLPSYAWKALRGNTKLYFRIGTTSSADPNHWDNYLVSTWDSDAASAPFMTISGAKALTSDPPSIIAKQSTAEGAGTYPASARALDA